LGLALPHLAGLSKDTRIRLDRVFGNDSLSVACSSDPDAGCREIGQILALGARGSASGVDQGGESLRYLTSRHPALFGANCPGDG